MTTPAGFVTEIDVDLSDGVDEATATVLRDLAVNHRVLVIRSRMLKPESQVAVMAALGSVLPGELTENPVQLVSNDPAKGTLGDREILFHSDMAFSQEPYTELSLYALDVVDDASSTMFADAVGVLERMPTAQRERLEQVEIVNALDLDTTRTAVAGDPSDPTWIWTRCPAIRRHPRTDRPVFWANQLHTVCVEGVGHAKSASLLKQAFDVLYDPIHLYEHRWRRGDLVVWDNIGAQHARGDVSRVGTRTLRRVANGSRTFREQFGARIGGAVRDAFDPGPGPAQP
jgi:taurine dioxygenase